MKKLAIVGGIIAVLVIGIILLTNKSQNDILEANDNPYGTDNLEPSTIELLADENYQHIILPDDLESKIDSNEGTYAYFFSPTCQYCKAFTPVLMPIAEQYSKTIDQLNVLEFDMAWNEYKIESTPTLIYFENGEEVARIVGDAPEEVVHEFFLSTES
ncbi:thioredoxin family protein [Lysinibacillus sp. 3P01SB]|uniref:thioredoxin family protein n=1 Tax=Lysinibacillus sp. 3P01SB TaxID=3132284 RepID=UPI0039A7414F